MEVGWKKIIDCKRSGGRGRLVDNGESCGGGGIEPRCVGANASEVWSDGSRRECGLGWWVVDGQSEQWMVVVEYLHLDRDWLLSGR
jgi:hypothetical protein